MIAVSLEMSDEPQNATTGKEYIYTIALLNPEDKIIQFIPVTFKMK